MNYITRNLENVVSQVTKEYPVVLVTGSRQVGKTTMLQKLMRYSMLRNYLLISKCKWIKIMSPEHFG